MLKLEPRVANAATGSANRGHDPLHIGPLHCHYGQDVITLLAERLAGVRANMALDTAFEINHHLWPMDGSQRRRFVPIDPLFAALLAHEGIDPLVAVWLSLQAGILDISDSTTGFQIAKVMGANPPDHADNRSEIVLKECAWTQKGILYAPALPETVTDLIVGRPLREVVSHPALDRFDLTIVRTDQREDVIHIHTDHVPRAADVDDLVAAMER